MPFQLSPGVEVNEVDLTTAVPSVGTTQGALGGVFSWGPVEEATLVTNEEDLVFKFGTPTQDNFETFFTAANFLSYTGALFISRAASNTAFNATTGNGAIANTLVKNLGNYQTSTFSGNTFFVAKYPSDLGNSLKISVCASPNAYSMNVAPTTETNTYSVTYTTGSNNAVISIVAANTSAANSAVNEVVALLGVGDFVQAGNTSVGTQFLKISNIGSAAVSGNTANVSISFASPYTLPANVTSTTLPRFWEYYNVIDSAPGTSTFTSQRGGSRDEIHVVIEDRLGRFTGIPGQILETFPFLSRSTDNKSEQGASNYYVNVINNISKYVWFANHPTGITATNAASITGLSLNRPWTGTFANGFNGANESSISVQALAAAYGVFAAADEIDISLVMTGKSVGGARGEGLYNHIMDNIVSVRKDCVLFVSPALADVVNVPGREVDNIISFKQLLRPSSFGFMDSGYKMQYDKYNDVFRWVPLNGDMAGLCARTDATSDPWFSPAGANRGIVKNIVKLAYNPADRGSRDLLYKNYINPVVNFKAEGTMLYGDKTLLSRPSALDRINVRRLFIVLQKAISRASRFSLFELNDPFTRSQFRNLVIPYLRDVQGRRGITEFAFLS